MHRHHKKNINKDGEKILLVGNSNVGKSVVFALLTGKYTTVSNYPGTTVEVAEGKMALGNKSFVIIDTPGINTLIPMSEDEKVTRDIILSENIHGVLQVADAKNLRRALLITLQLAEMGLPFLLDLNMNDEAKSRGIKIDRERLKDILGIDILTTVATEKKGINRLKSSLLNPKHSDFRIKYSRNIDITINKLIDILPESNISKRSIALMLLAGDESLRSWLYENLREEDIRKIEKIRESLQNKYEEPLSFVITKERLKAIDSIIAEVVKTSKKQYSRISWLISRVTIHPLLGIPVLLFVLYLIYEFVGKFGAQICVDFLENEVFGKYINPLTVNITNYLIPVTLIRELIAGEYGIVTMALTYSIAIIFPIVGTFFIAFSILEDSGYLPRLAVMVNKIFKLMGLNGKAVLPMILGLGCDTMATLTTRILESRKERIIVTLLLALGIPCSAQLGVIMGMLGSLSKPALFWWAGTVIIIIFLVGFLSSKLIPSREADFILELPPMRIPQLSNIIIKTLARIEWYMKEAVPLFILGTLILFVLDKLGILSYIEIIASPVVVGLLGLPSKATDSFIIGFLRRDYGAAGLFKLSESGMLTPVQAVVSLVTITLFVPCIANLFVIIKERGLKTALLIVAFIFPFAFLVGGILNFIFHYMGIKL